MCARDLARAGAARFALTLALVASDAAGIGPGLAHDRPPAASAPGRPAAAPVGSAPSDQDDDARELGYSVGFRFGEGLRRRPATLDEASVLAGLRDGLGGAAPRVGPERMQAALAALERRLWVVGERRRLDAVREARAAGDAFRARHARAPGVVTLPSGLQVRVLREGAGPTPGPTDRVTVRYRGTLVDGTGFDDSERRGGPSTLHVQGVMRGWTEALQRMRAGARWEVVIPPDLAYGERRFGRIPPGSTLVFDLELLAVQPEGAGGDRAPAWSGPAAGSPDRDGGGADATR